MFNRKLERAVDKLVYQVAQIEKLADMRSTNDRDRMTKIEDKLEKLANPPVPKPVVKPQTAVEYIASEMEKKGPQGKVTNVIGKGGNERGFYCTDAKGAIWEFRPAYTVFAYGFGENTS